MDSYAAQFDMRALCPNKRHGKCLRCAQPEIDGEYQIAAAVFVLVEVFIRESLLLIPYAIATFT